MNRYLVSQRRPGVVAPAALGALVGTLMMVVSCNDPNVPADSTPSTTLDYSGDYDSGVGGVAFQLDGNANSKLQLVATEVTWDATNEELHAQVVIRNSGDVELAGPDQVFVGSFDPSTVSPTNAEPLPCPMCVTCPCPWPWVFDYAGTFGGDGVLSPGESSTPVEWILHVPGGDSFSFRARLGRSTSNPRAGVISGSVFTDANGNGHREPDEGGISGARVSLQHGDTGSSALTDDNGAFAFDVAEEGLYEVVYEPELDCAPTTPLVRQVFIVRRPDGTLSGYDRADFGCGSEVPPDSSAVLVVGFVFEDVNRNGARDPGEPGIPAVRLSGATLQCPTFAEIVAHTDANGRYEMRLPGCPPPYVVQREPLTGFVDTTPNPVVFPGPTYPGPGAPPGMGSPPSTSSRLLRADFGVARVDVNEAAVEGVVFLDANGNGVRDADEPGLAGVQVSGSGLECMTPVIGLTRTDARGHYVLFQRQVSCPLPWSVGHEPVRGHCDTSPNPLHVPNALAQGLPLVYRADFGVAPCDSVPPPQPGFAIEGVVWFDANRDGVRDADEAVLSGVVLQLVSPCKALWQATTDARGHYAFPPVGCPVRAVAQMRPMFSVHTTPNPHPVDPNAVGPNGVLQVDFGVFELR